MKFGSLFAGIGGLDLGLEWAGMTCTWYVEINNYFLRVLAKHQPSIPRYGDVRDVGQHNLEPVDLIAGGFPCQPHSVAGKRRGAADDRNLWPEFSRIIGEMRPQYVLAENVPGIITTYLDTVLSDLESQGYTPWSFNIPACAFDAPHRRERIFIVAYATNTDARRNNRRAREGIRLDVEGDLLDQSRRDEGEHIIDTRGSHVANTDRTRELQPEGGKSNERRRIGNGGQDVSDAISDSEGGAYGKDSGGGRQGKSKQNISEGREVWGFTANSGGQWTVEPDVGRVAHGVPSRVDRLRGLGNAVVPQVAEWIGRRIMDYDRLSVASSEES